MYERDWKDKIAHPKKPTSTKTYALVACGTIVIFIWVYSTMHFAEDGEAAIYVQEGDGELYDAAYHPENEVAWLFPVGGKTKRYKMLETALEKLIAGGVRPDNIYVFEDDMSRPNLQADPDVARVCQQRGIRVIGSKIARERAETAENFGIHLARHYHFMLDAVFVGRAEKYGSSIRPPLELSHTYKFAVILEDDLLLANDIVKYFHEMSRVMRVDKSLFCVAAHQDNGFAGVVKDPLGPELLPNDFDFRRGEHFMAPGFMISDLIYLHHLRPVWLDQNTGDYTHAKQIGLKNGHWDRFFDSQIKRMECIYPEVARIAHRGADGFTVGAQAQLSAYDNVVLSTLPVSTSYGDLTRMMQGHYDAEIRVFLREAKFIDVLEEISQYRNQKLKIELPVYSDLDAGWAKVFNHFGLIGLGGYGGNPIYAKLRGVHKGSVFVHWMKNLVLLVGDYSEFSSGRLRKPLTQGAIYQGCFRDQRAPRIMPVFLPDSGVSLSPGNCLLRCVHNGFKYAGVQDGRECWCGSSLKQAGDSIPEANCNRNCHNNINDDLLCGGPFLSAVYSLGDDQESASQVNLLAREGTLLMKANPQESCEEACIDVGHVCDARLFPLLSKSCALMTGLIGCNQCVPTPWENGLTSPYADQYKICYTSSGNYFNCQAKGGPDVTRLCVCDTTT